MIVQGFLNGQKGHHRINYNFIVKVGWGGGLKEH